MRVPFLENMPDFLGNLDPFGLMQACLEVQMAWMKNPDLLAEELQSLSSRFLAVSTEYQNKFLSIDQNNTEQDLPTSLSKVSMLPILGQETPMTQFVQSSYQCVAQWLEQCIAKTPGVGEITKRKASFLVQQWLYMVAPENSFWFNPKAMQHYIESQGKSLTKGMQLWWEDMQHGNIGMVPRGQFVLGKNLATTPGKVIFRNALIEVIQYAPQTDKVHAIPILFVPPWINKYYILDINPGKSIVDFLVKQGFSVFIISWKNPKEDMRNTTFEDYLFQGILTATEIVKSVCQVAQLHAVGYCIGGTALSALMGWLNNNPNINNPIAHWTLLCSLVDFKNPGEIDIFIDEKSIATIEQMMSMAGYLDSKQMEFTFRFLRAPSLIWNYVVEKYLYGQEPAPFDVLHWNMDGTRLPEKMHSYYLRELYLKNKLIQKNALSFQGIPVDLGKITQPLYTVATEQDHITPWKETFKICNLVGGAVRHVLAASGHIMGILSQPQDPPKRHYWVSDIKKTLEPEEWLSAQQKVMGSWWVDWAKWLDKMCGNLQKVPSLGNSQYPPIEDAPGQYVREE